MDKPLDRILLYASKGTPISAKKYKSRQGTISVSKLLFSNRINRFLIVVSFYRVFIRENTVCSGYCLTFKIRFQILCRILSWGSRRFYMGNLGQWIRSLWVGEVCKYRGWGLS